MYNTFSIKPTYNTFSYHNIHTNDKTIIPIELTSPILGILIEQSLPQLNNDNKVINMHKENITHIVNKNTQCTCISVNMLTLLHDINFNNVNEIMKKIALFFLINDMVNYYYREQEDITFHQLSNSPKIMASIYDNYINFKVNHNDVSCDLARIILQNNQKSQNNYQNNIKQAYYMFNTPSLENNNDHDLIDNIFSVQNILSDLRNIPVNLKISYIVNFMGNTCFLLPIVKDFCVKTIFIKDGYNIDYDLFYNIDYNEFVSFIIEINNVFSYLMSNNSDFIRDYHHISDLVNYTLNNIGNPRVLSEPLSLLYFMILYSIPENSVPINSDSVKNVVDSINGFLERKDSISLSDLKKSINYYSKNTIPLDMIFSIIN